MKKQEIKIKFVDSWPEDEIVELYKAGGWWKETYKKSGIKFVLKGSFAFAVAIDISHGKAVGMGRIISDGKSDAYIQDLVVLPDYRDKGIGKELVKTLLDYCLSKGLIWIGLIAEPDQDGFYSTIGFKPMKDYVPMRYHMED